MSLNPAKIAIIGGGPAGLTLGSLLHKHGISFTIFEMREKPKSEDLAKPSGMLDLHEESGIAAIKECGLFNEFRELTGECTEAMKVMDKNGNILYADEGELSERPEISRHALTGLLLSHIPADRIKWNHKLFSTTTSTTSKHTNIELDFGPYGKETFDLVIGADGAWSKVRNSLTDVKPHYSGTQIITMTIRDVSKKYPRLAELVGQGSFTALGDRHGVMSQRGPQDSARIYVILTAEDEHFATTARLADQTAMAVKERVLGDDVLLGTWSPVLKELVAVASDEESVVNPGGAVDIRPLYMLPVGNSWVHKTGIMVIGDAAHLMCPWAGEGVNLAMWDSLLLAKAIIKAHNTAISHTRSFQRELDLLIENFEVDLVARVKEKAEETIKNGEMMFSENGAQAFANLFLTYRPPPE
jgi:2-polyprenyl-6-methoxyphenol hydroxylase-like FAD-dependent oxidoreductase